MREDKKGTSNALVDGHRKTISALLDCLTKTHEGFLSVQESYNRVFDESKATEAQQDKEYKEYCRQMQRLDASGPRSLEQIASACVGRLGILISNIEVKTYAAMAQDLDNCVGEIARLKEELKERHGFNPVEATDALLGKIDKLRAEKLSLEDKVQKLEEEVEEIGAHRDSLMDEVHAQRAKLGLLV